MQYAYNAIISIHTSLTGSDKDTSSVFCLSHDFNPHFPHGKWRSSGNLRGRPGSISIHTSLTGSDLQRAPLHILSGISIHTSLTGSDRSGNEKVRKIPDFNPHFPHGKWQRILRMPSVFSNFNPHFPHGKWRRIRKSYSPAIQFQSTLPSREVTGITTWYFRVRLFQSTLPSREVTLFRSYIPDR